MNKEKRIVGEGWNRVPKGCKNLFQLEGDEDQKTFDNKKHLYSKNLPSIRGLSRNDPGGTLKQYILSHLPDL